MFVPTLWFKLNISSVLWPESKWKMYKASAKLAKFSNVQFKYRWFFVWECCENISWFSMTRFVWALWHSFHFQLFFYYEFVTFWCQLNFKILLKTKLHIIETFFCPYIKLIESNFHNFGFFKEKSVTSVWQHWRKHGSLRKS